MIYLATDHRGFELKEKIKSWLTEWGQEFEDMGAFEHNAEDDYPDFVHLAAQKVSEDSAGSKAIILGGSGQGEAMVANRYRGVRAVVYYGLPEKIIELSREHNDANVLSLGAMFVGDEVRDLLKKWLEMPFSGDERHVRRLGKLEHE